MSTAYSKPVQVARDYYNSEDADNFYFHVWGGEDIHIGLYDGKNSIREASRETVKAMAAKLSKLGSDVKILDIGAGYGGAARYLAAEYGCQVTCLNLSEVENERDRQMNKEQGLDHLIDVVDGAFEDLPFKDSEFDIIWSQDAILHSSDREKVLKEACRVLKKGGEFVFTDPMQDDNCPPDVLQPIYDRIHLSSLGSPAFYKEAGEKAGFEFVEFEDHTSQLPTHYGNVLKEFEKREDELKGIVSDEYAANMKKGLRHWVEGGNSGHLAWGIFLFKKQ
ncbi:Sarcosine/dimethylglycine N-methyltransferase [Sedimentisphaera cyanobacteriorum]|uniref:Sarcosine/dimethylglycine N-methyltransferase n=1 Tax=Sedimentisphaera cyanobacteriorum TaxID=1940790 RepID=A0A1Q2HP91_9BACT|nr:class I SAM-dependent methyltransferase [Sedimentisphaera cyanobacteriorum]AQQ09180.1 Sarcosine/dimethylglycine N-methyltransferase [Sedimentisphaera cyanobacteriorum]